MACCLYYLSLPPTPNKQRVGEPNNEGFQARLPVLLRNCPCANQSSLACGPPFKSSTNLPEVVKSHFFLTLSESCVDAKASIFLSQWSAWYPGAEDSKHNQLPFLNVYFVFGRHGATGFHLEVRRASEALMPDLSGELTDCILRRSPGSQTVHRILFQKHRGSLHQPH